MDSSAFDTQSGGASPPSALLIDFGGVLTSSVLDAFRSLSVDLGLAPETALNVLSSNEEARTALIEHEVGRVAEEEFEEAFAAALTEAGVRVESQGLLARFDAYLDLEESMIETVMEVRRRGVPVALVSNSLGRDCYARIDMEELFDVSVISGKVGVRKPSRRIYRIACEQLGVAPEECILVDDLQNNLDGAARLGIRGVLHRTAPETIARLGEFLALPVGPTTTR